jgi:hypothetical protein
MAIEGFSEIVSIVYIAKRLFDMGRYELVENSFFSAIDYDVYYENMYSLIGNIFEKHNCICSERRYAEYHILSDPVIADFYILAGEYGRHNGIPDEANPYILAAKQQARLQLNFSYCLDWSLVGHTKPRRKFHSRLRLEIPQDDYVDLGTLAHRLIELYDWFSKKCAELNNLLAGEEAMAA